MKLFRRSRAEEPRREGSEPAAPTEEAGAAPPSEPPSENVAGDRGIPSVNRGRSMQSRVSSVLAVMLMSALGVGMLGWYYGRALNRSTQSQERAQAASRARAQGEMPLPPLGAFERPANLLGLQPTEPVIPNASPVHPSPPGTAKKSARELAFERRLRGPAFARQSGLNAAGGPSPTAGSASTLW